MPPASSFVVAVLGEHCHRQFRLADGTVTILSDGAISCGTSEWRLPNSIQLRIAPVPASPPANDDSLGVDSSSISDLSSESMVEVWDGISVTNYKTRYVESGARFQIERFWLEVQQQDKLELVVGHNLRTLPQARRVGRRDEDTPIASKEIAPSVDTLRLWFEALAAIQRQPGNSRQLLDTVARALVNPGGLDSALVLRYEENENGHTWQSESHSVPQPNNGFTFHADVVEAARQSGCVTVAEKIDSKGTCCVAAPYFNKDDEVAGMLYGTRSITSKNSRRSIRSSETQWTRVLAETLTAGSVRFAIEQEAARADYIYGRSFSPGVMKAFKECPNILVPRECCVTLLFADLRGFTELGDSLGSSTACELLTDVMNMLTEQIMKTDGVVLDYYGDGVAAMWNAPAEQPDHAERACRAALGMQQGLDGVNQRWAQSISEPIELAIGIATGLARVGNAGSDLRMKYGPRGTIVNLTSRLETAAKKLGVPILIGKATQEELPAHLATRRVCRAALPGIAEVCEVYELLPDDAALTMHRVLDEYEFALDRFESGDIDVALGLLESLSRRHVQLGGLNALCHQAKICRSSGEFDPVANIALLPAN